MRIGIDARMYGPGARGLGRYVQKLVDNLAELDNENEYYIFLSPDNWDNFQTTNKKFIKVLVKSHWYSLAEQILFPLLLYRFNLDLVHFPHFNVPLFYRRCFIVTIHDLIVSHYPDSRATTLPTWLYKIKLYAYRLVLRHAVINSERIITVSNFTKQDIERFYPRVADKIEVTHEGFSVEEKSSSNVDLESEYKINKPYLMTVGAAYPHKNLFRLLQAWKLLQNDFGDDYQLVIIGRHDFFYQRLIKEVKKIKLDSNVIFTDFVPDEHLPKLYQYAIGYIFPSYLEGFGLPAIEAQSYGLPVLASNNSSLPEILGNSALYFDPFDINDIARTMKKLIGDEDLRQKMEELGYKNISRFDWKNMAKKVIKTYQDVYKFKHNFKHLPKN